MSVVMDISYKDFMSHKQIDKLYKILEDMVNKNRLNNLTWISFICLPYPNSTDKIMNCSTFTNSIKLLLNELNRDYILHTNFCQKNFFFEGNGVILESPSIMVNMCLALEGIDVYEILETIANKNELDYRIDFLWHEINDALGFSSAFTSMIP